MDIPKDIQEGMKALLNPLNERFCNENHNSNETVENLRELLELAYKYEEYPYYEELERSWRSMGQHSELIERGEHPGSDPLSSFASYLEFGLIPPPEILLVLRDCISYYFLKGGDISLDEAFFGRPYKKRTSLSYVNSKSEQFLFFHSMYVKCDRVPFNVNLAGLSLEKRAEKYIESMRPPNDPDFPFSGESEEDQIDVDTFLRNYRRWRLRENITEEND
jgi:hypothetical protein